MPPDARSITEATPLPSRKPFMPISPRVRKIRRWVVLLAIAILSFQGCGAEPTPISVDMGTTAMVQLPNTEPPILNKELADRVRVGMSQRDVLTILRDAGRVLPSVKSELDLAYEQSMLNPVRYTVSLLQGKRKLMLDFRSEKLEKKTTLGFD